MGTKHAPRYCRSCDQRVLGVASTPNHVLHLLLTLITVGLWLPVWLLIALFSDQSFRCPQCGGKTKWVGNSG